MMAWMRITIFGKIGFHVTVHHVKAHINIGGY